MRSRWFGSAAFRYDGFWLPGRPARHAADLVLRPDGIVVARDEAWATLPWPVGRTRPWSVSPCFHGGRHAYDVGIALRVSEPVAPDLATVIAATRTRRNRLNWGFSAPPGPLVPLRARSHILPVDQAERATLRALVHLLTTQSVARARLGDPERVAGLVAAMAEAPLLPRNEPTGFSRRAFEVHNAIRMTGHRLPAGGRPLAADAGRNVEAVVADVRRYLDRNPYTADIDIDDAFIRRLVERCTVDVEPWPFAALTTD